MEEIQNIWLIGEVTQYLPDSVPTVGHVLRTYFYHRLVFMKQKGPSFIDVAKELIFRWQQSDKITVAQRDVVQRLKKLEETFDMVKKGKHRRTANQVNYEKKFQELLGTEFDIAPKQSYHHGERRDRVVQMEDLNVQSTDSNFVEPENVRSKGRGKVLKLIPFESVDMEIDCVNDADDEDFETTLSAYYKSKFSINSSNTPEIKQSDVIQKIINSPDVTSALDRTNTTSSSFTIILAAIARSLDVDLTECVFSTSTLLRRRKAHRETIEAVVKDEFLATIKTGLVVHWDGKRLKDTTSEGNDQRNSKVDRIAIVVTGLNIQKIIAIAKSEDGTGVEVAETVHEHLNEWGILDSIVAMCTDTTSANTGEIQGACVLFEVLLNRNVIYLACRHHMFEVIIGGVFIMLFGETTGPTIEMFEHFKRDWPLINKTLFKVKLI